MCFSTNITISVADENQARAYDADWSQVMVNQRTQYLPPLGGAGGNRLGVRRLPELASPFS